MKTKQIYFKSDFKVFLESKAGWGVPFRLKFYTNVPSRPYIACFDGTTYTNCHLENETTLCVSFNDHKLGLGTLWCAPTFYLDDACFSDNVCDEYVQPFKVEFKGAPDVEVIDDFFLIEIPNKGIYDRALETVGKIKYGNVSIDNVKIKKGQTARIEFDEESQHVGEFGFCVDNTRGGYYQYADYVKVSEKEFVAYDDMIIYAYSFFITPKTNAKVIVETPGENCNIVLSLTGSSTLETLGTLPAYYQKGDKGEAGPVGPQGPQGEKGDKGDPGSFEDAPADGKQYARQNNAWAVVAGGGVADAYTKAESDERYQAKGNYQPAGNYATTAQLANYQPTITDLDQIRANAALGATAVQTETDPTVPSWAKQPNKPTYTAAEVGAASQEELTQLDLKVGEKLDDAPLDGKQYTRAAGEWQEVVTHETITGAISTTAANLLKIILEETIFASDQTANINLLINELKKGETPSTPTDPTPEQPPEQEPEPSGNINFEDSVMKSILVNANAYYNPDADGDGEISYEEASAFDKNIATGSKDMQYFDEYKYFTSATMAVSSFNGCSKLERITIPAQITDIPERAFYECTELQTVKFDGEVVSFGVSAFQSCSKLNITLPNTLKTIGNSCFHGCRALNITEIPASVESIGKWAFMTTGIQKVKILNTSKVVSIVSTNDFNGKHVYVPDGLYDQYLAANIWSTMTSYIHKLSEWTD